MSKEEETEIKMKNKNLFDWVQKVEKVTELEQGEDRNAIEDDGEEKRMETRDFLCKEIVNRVGRKIRE